ncbi:hypothetical protein F5X99DRAFT_409897 [Biscogniauxia marginata]|nr:hypothetical protein F5X99DRAFT_409897 [Biscogniauxia marginata]
MPMMLAPLTRTLIRARVDSVASRRLQSLRFHMHSSNQKPTSVSQQHEAEKPASTLSSGVLVRMAEAYSRSSRARPFQTQTTFFTGVFVTGDLLAQSVSGKEHDISQTAGAAFVGATAAVPMLVWFRFLSTRFQSTVRPIFGRVSVAPLLSALKKVTIDQMLFTPTFLVYYFAVQSFSLQSLLSGQWFEHSRARITSLFIPTWEKSAVVRSFASLGKRIVLLADLFKLRERLGSEDCHEY